MLRSPAQALQALILSQHVLPVEGRRAAWHDALFATARRHDAAFHQEVVALVGTTDSHVLRDLLSGYGYEPPPCCDRNALVAALVECVRKEFAA